MSLCLSIHPVVSVYAHMFVFLDVYVSPKRKLICSYVFVFTVMYQPNRKCKWFYVCFSLCLCINPIVRVDAHMFLCLYGHSSSQLKVYMLIYLFVFMFMYPPNCKRICSNVCLSLCLCIQPIVNIYAHVFIRLIFMYPPNLKCKCLNVCLSLNLCNHPIVSAYAHIFVCLYVNVSSQSYACYMFLYLLVFMFVYQPNRKRICSSVCLSLYFCIHPTVSVYAHMFVSLHVYVSTNLYVYHLFMCLFVFMFTYPLNRTCICFYVCLSLYIFTQS